MVAGTAKQKNQGKKRRVPIWARVIIIFVSIILVFLLFSVIVIRYFVGDTLSFKGTLAMATYAGLDLPDGFCRYVLDVDREYSGLPQLMVSNGGAMVETLPQYEDRRAELLALYEEYMYGAVPQSGFATEFEVLEQGTAFEGKANRQQIKLTVTTDRGSTEAVMLVYTPATAEEYGMFIGLNFSGNTSVWNDPAIIPSATQESSDTPGQDSSSWPIDEIIAQGYGVATMCYDDWAADDAETYRERTIRIFNNPQMTAFSAWAFGLMRGVDYLEQMDGVDMNAIASVGHSRLARVSLWAGANDPRISLVTASCGGGYLRSPLAARITTKGTSNHWFTSEYFSFEGRDAELPVDIHMLYALVADRHLYISMGRSDLASDPVATYDALQNTKAVWRDIYDIEVIPDGTYEDLKLDEPVFSEGIAVHMHQEGHEINNTDWAYYMAYMAEYLQ